MAGDWIKMRCNLDTDWRVIQIACQLGMSELHVVGCLWKLWTWADQNTADGNAVSVTDVTLDRFTGVTGFASAMRNVGWPLDTGTLWPDLPHIPVHVSKSFPTTSMARIAAGPFPTRFACRSGVVILPPSTR